MTLPNDRARPARGILRAGFFFILLALCFLNGLVLPVLAATTQDDPPPTQTASPSLTASIEVSASPTLSPTITPSLPPSVSSSPTEIPATSPSPTPQLEPSPDSSLTPSITPSSSPEPTATILPIPTKGISYPPGSILISEVAWSGTIASAHDEWIELYNPGSSKIDLDGWILTDDADIHILLSISMAPYSFALLERTDDSTVSSIQADQIYTGSLKNSGDALILLDPAGGSVDSANQSGGAWPAGDSSSRASMERLGGDDRPGNWATFTGHFGIGLDSLGNPILGTPRGVNSIHLPPPATAAPTGSLTPPTSTALPTEMATQPVAYSHGAILVNEIAWAGTAASASDEWIELYNPNDVLISLEGWRLHDDGDISIILEGTITPNGYFLLERSDDQTVANIPADFIYNGSLSNGGGSLQLLDPNDVLIDSANLKGGSWPAGDHHKHASMERRGGDDRPGNWATFTGHFGSGVDAKGSPIQGTPRQINSIFFPTPQPTWIPGKVVINEVLIRPHYDWEGLGGVDTGDEFIELINLGPLPVNLRGWILDDIEGAGSRPYTLPNKALPPGAFIVLFRSRTHIALNDSGDKVRLLAPNGRLVDQLSYLRVRAYNLSYGRLPDGSGHLTYGLWPTPGQPNLLFKEPILDADALTSLRCPRSSGTSLRLARLGRYPMVISRLSSRGFRICWQQG